MLKTLALTILLLGCPAPKPSVTPAATGPDAAAATGTLAGSVHKVGAACQAPKAGSECDGPAGNYDLVVLAKDGKTEVGRTKTDANGVYSVALPGGEYTIITPAGMTGQVKRNDVVIANGATATLNLDIDTGVR